MESWVLVPLALERSSSVEWPLRAGDAEAQRVAPLGQTSRGEPTSENIVLSTLAKEHLEPALGLGNLWSHGYICSHTCQDD
jgi:hypothetical protein